MKRFVTGALAIAATSAVGFAEPADSSDWLELDSEINSLATSRVASQDGMGWTALIRYTYTFSSDDIATAGGDDVSGFKFEDADMAFWGGVGSYQWRLSFDLASLGREFDLEDAYVMWECDEYFTTLAGRYKARVLMSNAIDPEKQLFIDRSALGSAFDFWDEGVAINGTQDVFRWYANLQNGGNGQLSGHGYSVRGEYDFGTGAGMYEGAMGANDDLNGTVGVVYYNNDNITGDAMMFALDARGTYGPFGFGGEVAFVDENLNNALATDSDFSRLATTALFFANDDDSTPFGLWLSYLINDEFEGGVRWDDLDNFDDESVLSVVLNWYRSGNNAKWQAQWTNVDGDGDDGSIFQVGLVLGSTR